MLRSTWRCSALAFGAIVLTAGLANAQDDTIRLGRSSADDSTFKRLDLKANDDSEVSTTGYRGGFHGGGFHGGYGGGYHGGYGYRVGYYGGHHGYYGGYRGYYGGYRGGFAIGFGYGYRPYYGYGYGGYYPYYSSYYYPSYYGYSSYPSYYYGGYCGISDSYAAPAPVVTQLSVRPTVVMPRIQDDNLLPNPVPANPNGAYRYDGGPDNPVPMPREQAAPKQPIERQVSLPAAPAVKKYTYAAYGEQPGPVVQPRDEGKTLIVKGAPK